MLDVVRRAHPPANLNHGKITKSFPNRFQDFVTFRGLNSREYSLPGVNIFKVGPELQCPK